MQKDNAGRLLARENLGFLSVASDAGSNFFQSMILNFLNAYVPNNIIWGGWQQFVGQGDAQASQYLLPGTLTNLANNQVPNFTTRDLSVWFARKIFGFDFSWKDSNGNLHPMTFPCLTPFGAQFFRAFVCPVVCRKFDDTQQLWALTNTVSLSDFLRADQKILQQVSYGRWFNS